MPTPVSGPVNAAGSRLGGALAGRAWLTVALLWFIALLNYLDRLMLTTMREPIKADVVMTDAQFGLLTSVFLWVYAAFSPFGGFLADRYSRTRVIIASLVIWSAMTWLTGHMHSVSGLLWVRGFMGLSEACYVPAALALIADYHPGRTRSLATGLHMSGIYAGAALGGVGGVVAEHWGWRTGFQLFGGLGLGYGLLTLLLLRDCAGRPGARGPADRPMAKVGVMPALAALFSQPAFLILLVINALVGMANWGIYGWLPTYLKERFALGLGAAGLTATGYIQVASFVGVLVGGLWADRWSRSQPRARALVPALATCAVAPCLFFSTSANLLILAVAGLIVFGFGRGCFDANHMPILRYVTDQRYSATGYGFLNFISCLAGGVMIYVGGWLQDAHVDLGRVFQASAIGLVVVGLLLFALKPQPGTSTVSGESTRRP